jgi:hypothetical protein
MLRILVCRQRPGCLLAAAPTGTRTSPAHPATRRLPGAIWALGFVSLQMDVSSETMHSLPPVFMVAALEMRVATAGLIEGAARATAPMVKVFSGTLSE